MSSSNDYLETDSAIDRPQSAFETSSASSTSNTAIMSYTNGQPGWAIALMIVIPLLVLLCCIGYCYCIFVRDNDQDQEEKDVVVKRTNRSSDVRGRPRRRDDGKSLRCSRSRYDSFHSGRTSRARYPRRSRGERSRKDNDGPSISLSNPQDPRFSADEFTVHTYTTMKKTAQDPQMTAIVLHEPNYEKPDPEGETTAGAIALALTNGHDKIRSVEPDTKPKLEPEESDTKPVPSQKAGPFVSSFVKVQAQKRVPGRRRTVDTSSSDNEDDNDNDSYGFRSSQPHIYAPTRKNKVSDEELKGSFVTFTTKGPNEEELTRAKKSINKKKERDSSSSSSNSRKRFEESRRRSSLTLLSFCLLYTSPSPRDLSTSRMPSSA